jgi:hypothetical protein
MPTLWDRAGVTDTQEVKKLLALYPVLLKPWEAPSEEGDHMVSATAGLVFTRGKDGPTGGTPLFTVLKKQR